jgi:hypothetical protein
MKPSYRNARRLAGALFKELDALERQENASITGWDPSDRQTHLREALREVRRCIESLETAGPRRIRK